ncbi:hypothetical protein OF83DRAFT_1159243 [Amylostereum chailletii]|nr:hypothetical protein OF83DRAFT_1159243 [Amylostereum chailletii]
MILFTVVGSESNVIIGGRTHLQDLIKTTAQIHYEVFRSSPCPHHPCHCTHCGVPNALGAIFATPLLLRLVYLYLHLIV